MLCDGAALSPLQAVAGRLWLQGRGDENGAMQRTLDAYWSARPVKESGDDPYEDVLTTRMACSACTETFRLENLAVCPNCFSGYCYRHGRACACGFTTVG